jgi:hypothetical protein
MFCPSCGSENTGLPYCKRCGANLSALTTQPQLLEVNLTKPAVILSIALVILTLGGFGALVGGARALAAVVHGNDPLTAVIFMGMIVILTVDVFLARQLSKIISASLSPTSQSQMAQTRNANRLPAQPEQPGGARLHAAPSVTENTTWFFEPAPTYRAPSETDKLIGAPNPSK